MTFDEPAISYSDSSESWLGEHTAIAAREIEWRARKLARHKAFLCEEDDIAQELRLHVWANFSKFDPSRANVITFLRNVLERRIISMIRERMAQKRSGGRVHEPLVEAESDEDFISYSDLAMDVSETVATLPANQQWLCSQVIEESQKSIASDLGVSRRQVITSLAEIRQLFEDVGLRHYVD